MRPHLKLTAVGVALLFASCSSGGSGGPASSLSIVSVSVLQGAVWEINRPIDVVFNQAIDFSTVNLNTINITDLSGGTATGVFSQPAGSPARVRFQPTCPTLPDFSDAGLLPSTQYLLKVLSTDTGGVTVRSTAGEPLAVGRTVGFSTPDSLDPQALFLDIVPGPPRIRVRGAPGVDLDDENATHVELGTGAKFYFELDPSTQTGMLFPVGTRIPLNLYSDLASQVSVVVEFDQPVDPTDANITSERITLEYFDNGGWTAVGTDVELIANCTETGAAARLTPRGILPQHPNTTGSGFDLRVNLKAGFTDLTGDQTTSDTTHFANMDTEEVMNPGTLDASIGADEVLEPFILAGNEPDSLEDLTAAFGIPHADWGEGEVRASFAFGGSGGPGGNFDWHIPPGTTVILDTSSDSIEGGPGGVPASTQAVINGVVDIRNMFIPSSSRLIVIGPNVLTILASGTVTIEGSISVQGSDNQGVGTLNTTNLPEPGAAGQAGGGSGGTGSFLTSQSTPRGGNGFGAFEVANTGGEGGESCYSASNGPSNTCNNSSTSGADDRRAAGGGGGVLGFDIIYDFEGDLPRCQTLYGMDAESGGGGGFTGTGAVSQTARAMGGAAAPSPFADPFDDNNFLGSLTAPSGELILGELVDTWAGGGGGAGGDAVSSATFPLVPFTITGDEKGSGGGGAGGGLKILAIGEIVIGVDGVISAEGGRGGGGENTNFFDRVGGGSGGGSGGHIVFSSASFIEVQGAVMESGSPIPWYSDNPASATHQARPITAVGGQGGAGHCNQGGNTASGPTPWRRDYIPLSHFDGTMAPPSQDSQFLGLVDYTDELGPVLAAGGDGGPGIIQFHVDEPEQNLRFPGIQDGSGMPQYGFGLDVTASMAPAAFGWTSPTAPTDNMVPFFGKLSKSRSKWIPLGLARIAPGGGTDQLLFMFCGVDANGVVLRDGGMVEQLPAIVPSAFVGDPALQVPPYLDSELTMVFDAQPLGTNEIYKRNANLLRGFTVELEENNAPTPNVVEFEVVSAEYAPPPLNQFRCTVETSEETMQDFVDSALPNATLASLIPRCFRVVLNTLDDVYPVNTEIKILFDATRADLQGNPSDALSYSTSNGGNLAVDITELNAAVWDFFRFQVEFDLDNAGTGVDLASPRPGLRMLKVPFEF